MKRFRRGERVLLPENVNCVPKGTYKVVDSSREELHLRLGKRIFVSIVGAYKSKVQKVPRDTACLTQTEFSERYRILLEEHRRKPDTTSDVFTFCAVTPEVMEIVN